MDNLSWGALALALAVLAGIWTWYAFRHRGLASGVRGVALVLLPIAAYLTHTLRMLGRVGNAIADWATGFVFSPTVWVGVAMGAVAIGLFFLAPKLSGDEPKAPKQPKAVKGRQASTAAPSAAPAARASSGGDEDFSDIEAILKKHGIS